MVLELSETTAHIFPACLVFPVSLIPSTKIIHAITFLVPGQKDSHKNRLEKIFQTFQGQILQYYNNLICIRMVLLLKGIYFGKKKSFYNNIQQE